MDRAPRTARRPLLLLALLAAAPVLVAAPWAFAEMAEGPTVSFAATGAVPFACGSHPNVSSLQVKVGTKIVFANRTDTTATLTVGGEKVADLDPGTGAVVKLRQGQHEVRLSPQCVVVIGTDAVVVSVLTGVDLHASPTGDPTPPEEPAILAEPGSSGGSSGGASIPPGVSGAPDRTSGSGPSPSSGTSRGAPGGPGTPATTVTASAHPVAADSGDGPMESVVIDVQRIPLGDPRDPKDGRLLAVIAAICVIGVTAAIIRAIVSQRTSSAVSP
jgi:hypothetical protein